jgi:hypothetical protein
VHLLVNKRRICKDARYTQFQERRLLMWSVQLYNFFSCCDGTLWLYRPVLSSPGCVIRTDDATPSSLLTLAMLSTLRTKPVMLNHAQLAPPTSHLYNRRYVLVLTYIFICFCQVDALKKVSPLNFRLNYFSPRNYLHALLITDLCCCNNYWLNCIVKLLLT